MTWFNLLLTGIGTNVDNMGIGLAYGFKGTRIRHAHNILINLIGVMFTLAGAFVGSALKARMDIRTAHAASSIILCALGLVTLFQSFATSQTHHRGPNTELNQDNIRSVSTWREAWMLGLALSFTNAVAGTGAGLSGAGIGASVVSIGAWGYLFIWAGNLWARRMGTICFGHYRGLAAGLLLILVGLRQSLF